MPMYQFRCTRCLHLQEEIVRRPDSVPSPCDECGSAVNRDRSEENPPTMLGCWSSGRTFTRGGESFTSGSDRKKYEEKFKISGVEDPNSIKGRQRKDEAIADANGAAQRSGYNSHHEFRVSKRREKALKAGTASAKMMSVGKSVTASK